MTPLGSSGERYVPNTTPYRWPWNGMLDPRGTAALLIDPIDPDPRATRAVRDAAAEVSAALSAAGGVVIRVHTAPPRGSAPAAPPQPLSGSAPDAASAPSAALIPTNAHVTAAGIDGFYGSPLDPLLRSHGIERLLLVGRGLETSVHSTMRSANDRGYECLLVVDACAPYRDDLVASSVSMIEMSGGIFGAVGNATAVIQALERHTTPQTAEDTPRAAEHIPVTERPLVAAERETI